MTQTKRPPTIPGQFKAIGIRVIDPLKVESIRKMVPVRRLVSHDHGAAGDPCFGEAHSLGFVLKNVRQRAPVALPEDNHATAFIPPVSSEAPVNAIGARVGRADVASDISAVDLHRPRENQAFCLARKGFPDLVREDECRLVGKPRASR